MGRKVTDGLSVDVTAPAATLVETQELVRIDNWSGFTFDEISAAETDRALAIDISEAIYSVKVPVGTCGTRGNYVKWSAGAGFKKSATDLADDGATRTLDSIAKVETPRNSAGYARLRLLSSS
jgi:hypothetical protein